MLFLQDRPTLTFFLACIEVTLFVLVLEKQVKIVFHKLVFEKKKGPYVFIVVHKPLNIIPVFLDPTAVRETVVAAHQETSARPALRSVLSTLLTASHRCQGNRGEERKRRLRWHSIHQLDPTKT